MNMKTSNRGVLEICEKEGIVPTVYYDSVGVKTWGVGHTSGAGAPDPNRMNMAWPDDVEAAIDRALAQFKKDLGKYEDRVNRALKVPVKQHQFDVLVGFDMNTGGIFRAKLTAAINAGDPKASRHFFGWLRPPELRERREDEAHLYDTGNYDANGDAIAVWRTNGKGKIAGRYKIMHGNEVLKRMSRQTGLKPVDNGSGWGDFFAAIVAAIKRMFGR